MPHTESGKIAKRKGKSRSLAPFAGLQHIHTIRAHLLLQNRLQTIGYKRQKTKDKPQHETPIQTFTVITFSTSALKKHGTETLFTHALH